MTLQFGEICLRTGATASGLWASSPSSSCSEKLLGGVFSSFGDLLVEAPVSTAQIDEAKRIAKERKLPPNDALHAIIARDNLAIIITRDKHFEQLCDIAESRTPEEVTFGWKQTLIALLL